MAGAYPEHTIGWVKAYLVYTMAVVKAYPPYNFRLPFSRSST